MQPDAPVVVALAVIHGPDGSVLVVDDESAAAASPSLRLPGGPVRFRETGRDAVRRNVADQLGVDLHALRWMGAVEHHFEANGQPGHEVALLFHARLAGEDRDPSAWSGAATASWRARRELGQPDVVLQPPGVRSFLEPPSDDDGPGTRPSKVVAYVVFRGRLAIFTLDDPANAEAAWQVPKGSVETGEPLEQAVLREAEEETELAGLYVVRYLGARDHAYAPHRGLVNQRHFFLMSVREEPPETWTATPLPEAVDAGGTVEFHYRWVPLDGVPRLHKELDAMLDAVRDGAGEATPK